MIKTDAKRAILGEVIPLEMPYTFAVFPVYSCNLRCEFCIHSKPKQNRNFVCENTFLDFDVFKKVIDNMADAGWCVKLINFAGWGEPLMHPQIAEMVAYVNKKGVTERTDITTNGILLTEELSDNLIDAGLTWLRVSLNGLSREDFWANCNTNVNFEKLRSNVEYCYNRCGDRGTHVYVKIMEYMVKDIDKELLFYKLFKPISHVADKEYLVQNTFVDNDFTDKTTFEKTRDGDVLPKINICPQPFYNMQIDPDGNFRYCCAPQIPVNVGNANDGTASVWKGDALRDFQKRMLRNGFREASKVCEHCTLYNLGIYPEDVLDDYKEQILERMKVRNG